jgi:glyoxylase-like metal-dependent hydrolase (beta-lactamase superfamily II)
VLREQQSKAGTAFLAHAQFALSGAACSGGSAAGRDRSRDVHAFDHDHVGWNTQQKDGKWVPTFPNARYVFSQPDVEYFSRIDADPKEGPAELGTFRECVVPILEYGKADLVTGGPHRLNEFLEIDSAPGHSPGHVFFKLQSKGRRAAFIGDVWHHLLQVYYPDWNFPKNSDAAQARVSRRKVLDYCASSGALVFPGHVGLPFAGHIEKTQDGYRPDFPA